MGTWISVLLMWKLRLYFYSLETKEHRWGKAQLPKNDGRAWKIAVHCTASFDKKKSTEEQLRPKSPQILGF